MVGSTQLRFTMTEAADVSLSLHDAAGRLAAVVANGLNEAGTHSVGWDATGTGGRRLVSDAYFARLEADGEVQHGRVLIRR